MALRAKIDCQGKYQPRKLLLRNSLYGRNALPAVYRMSQLTGADEDRRIAEAVVATAAYSYWPTDKPEDRSGSRDPGSWGGRWRDNNGTRHLDATRDASHTQTARGKIHPLVGNKEESFNILFLQQRVLLPRVTRLELVVPIIDELLGFVGHVNPTVKWDNKWWSRNSHLLARRGGRLLCVSLPAVFQ